MQAKEEPVVIIRPMLPQDIEAFPAAFAAQGWPGKTEALFQRYYRQQEAGERKVFVAEAEGVPAGYATLLPQAPQGPFAGKGIPCVCDFNVLERFQRRGIGNALLAAIEDHARARGPALCLGVGLYRGYGAAQRLYARRGYLPDGSGVWYEDEQVVPGRAYPVDDELVLYLCKTFA